MIIKLSAGQRFPTELQVTLYLELWWLHMKAEEKIVAFMFFSVVMQFVYSLGKK